MRCPRLNELPSAPPDKSGWPWTAESESLSDTMLNGAPLPRISIVTPSYNQGQFIEETIRSVLLQGYPNLEYIVIDGGSTDNSVEIIRKYAPWLCCWVSQQDKGQADAINKGLQQATGSLVGWINSDDVLLGSSLERLGQSHSSHPGDIIAGDVIDYEQDSEKDSLYRQYGITFENVVMFWTRRVQWHQPGIFFPKMLLSVSGYLDASLRYVFDYDLLCRMLRRSQISYLGVPIARFRRHRSSKTTSEGEGFPLEFVQVSRRYWSFLPCSSQNYALEVANYLFRVGVYFLMRRKPVARALFREALRTDARCIVTAPADWIATRLRQTLLT